MRTPNLEQTEKEHWIEVLPHDPNFYLETVGHVDPCCASRSSQVGQHYSFWISQTYGGFLNPILVLSGRRNGLPSVSLLSMDEQMHPNVRTVEWEEHVYGFYLGNNCDPTLRNLRLHYSSFVTPPSIFDIDVETLDKHLLKVKEVPNFDPSQYESWRDVATASDGSVE